MNNPVMISRVSILRAVATMGLAALTSSPSRAQDGVAGEVKALRQLVEQQAKQIEALTAEIARLGTKIEGHADAAPAAPVPRAGDNPEYAVPAARVVTPQVPGNVHIVVKGESLEKIAKAHGTTITDLQKLNKITDPKKLQIGQQLLLPPPIPKKEAP